MKITKKNIVAKCLELLKYHKRKFEILYIKDKGYIVMDSKDKNFDVDGFTFDERMELFASVIDDDEFAPITFIYRDIVSLIKRIAKELSYSYEEVCDTLETDKRFYNFIANSIIENMDKSLQIPIDHIGYEHYYIEEDEFKILEERFNKLSEFKPYKIVSDATTIYIYEDELLTSRVVIMGKAGNTFGYDIYLGFDDTDIDLTRYELDTNDMIIHSIVTDHVVVYLDPKTNKVDELTSYEKGRKTYGTLRVNKCVKLHTIIDALESLFKTEVFQNITEPESHYFDIFLDTYKGTVDLEVKDDFHSYSSVSTYFEDRISKRRFAFKKCEDYRKPDEYAIYFVPLYSKPIKGDNDKTWDTPLLVLLYNLDTDKLMQVSPLFLFDRQKFVKDLKAIITKLDEPKRLLATSKYQWDLVNRVISFNGQLSIMGEEQVKKMEKVAKEVVNRLDNLMHPKYDA